jgi:hypothetical protein
MCGSVLYTHYFYPSENAYLGKADYAPRFQVLRLVRQLGDIEIGLYL